MPKLWVDIYQPIKIPFQYNLDLREKRSQNSKEKVKQTRVATDISLILLPSKILYRLVDGEEDESKHVQHLP